MSHSTGTVTALRSLYTFASHSFLFWTIGFLSFSSSSSLSYPLQEHCGKVSRYIMYIIILLLLVSSSAVVLVRNVDKGLCVGNRDSQDRILFIRGGFGSVDVVTSVFCECISTA